MIPEADQRRNGLVFAIITALGYLVAPVFYVGVLHAAILESLGASDTLANLPGAVYLWVTPVPVLVAWWFPSPSLLRPLLTHSLLVKGGGGILVALVLAAAPRAWWIPALVLHAGLIGIAGGIGNMCVWELLGRGLSAERRAGVLGWTFGLGPIFAVLGSCASQLVLTGTFQDWIHIAAVPKPWCYVLLFGATGPAMWVSAALVRVARVPPAPEPEAGVRWDVIREGVRQYFQHPLIRFAVVAFLLTYGGTMIMGNLSLYARTAIGDAPEQYAGLQLALRFGFKCIAGFALAWLLARVSGRASLVATTATCLAGVAWALAVPGKWYLLSFGLLGAGELFYVYYVNFIIGCSPPARIRENTAYTNLLTAGLGFVPLGFGLVSDRFGIPASLSVALAMFLVAIAVVLARLPRVPAMDGSARSNP